MNQISLETPEVIRQGRMKALVRHMRRAFVCAILLTAASPQNAEAVRIYDNYPSQFHYLLSEPTVTNWEAGWSVEGVTGWDYVGRVGDDILGASGLYLGNGWVLTAKHVGIREYYLGGNVYTPVPGARVDFGNTDLLLFKVFDAPDLPQLALAGSMTQNGANTVLIGHGSIASGVGDRVKSWGEANVIASNSSTFTTGGTGAVGISGDSGGAGFIYNAAQEKWELAGIMTHAGGTSTILQSVSNTTNAAIITSTLPLGYNFWTEASSWVGEVPPQNDGTATVRIGSPTSPTVASLINVNYSVVDTPYHINRLEFVRPTANYPTQSVSGEELTFSASGGVNPVIYIDNPGGTNFSIYNDVKLNAPLSIARNTDGNYVVSFFGNISGVGGISKEFTFSTLRLTGNNTFEGNVTISRGTLEIGSNTALGRGTLVLGGAVASGISAYNGAYQIDNAVTVGGVASSDTSTTLFSGELTFNGNITLNQGSAVNTKAKALAAASGAKVTLAGNIGQDTSAGGTSRSLHLMGANVAEESVGGFLLKGNGTYTGQTILGNVSGSTINRAKVQIEGDLSASSKTSVYSGMILSGTGRISALSVVGMEISGTSIFSVIDPGSSLKGQGGATVADLGALRVAGNADFLSESNLRLQLGAAGNSDRLVLENGGLFSIAASGTRLSLDLLSGQVLSGIYVLASYEDVDGTFAEVYFNGILVENPTENDSFGGGYRLSYSDHQLILIPEPKPMILVTAALGAILFSVGRKRISRGMG